MKDKNKIYSLHEPQVYCIAKGKDHKQYEYGNKVSVASTAKGNLIVGVVSHEINIHDGNTLPEVLEHIKASRGKAATFWGDSEIWSARLSVIISLYFKQGIQSVMLRIFPIDTHPDPE